MELLRDEPMDRDASILAAVAIVFVGFLSQAVLPLSLPKVKSVGVPPAETLTLQLLPRLEENPEESYVRAAPDGIDGIPPETLNIADRDQIAAQEGVTALSADESPAMAGDMPNAIQLVQGNPFQSSEPVAPPPSPQSPALEPAQPQMPAPANLQEVPPPEALDLEPEAAEGLFARENPDENIELVEETEPVEDLQPTEITSDLDGTGQSFEFSPPRPQSQPSNAQERRETPRLALDNAHSPLRQSELGVQRIGRTSWKARYSEFSVYWERVREVIEQKWNTLLANANRSLSYTGERITFEIIIHRDGTLVELNILHSGVSRFEEFLATDSIQGTAPYFKWTPEMIAQMGDQTEYVFTFIYPKREQW
jgi:hypothetical protein|tara:strand:- start:900 stop:2000 length:1101 start_codon:yes stop_codon:yes gene_type:complete